MNEHDRKLLQQARQYDYLNWPSGAHLIDEAETEEGRRMLNDYFYHLSLVEEGKSGMI